MASRYAVTSITWARWRPDEPNTARQQAAGHGPGRTPMRRRLTTRHILAAGATLAVTAAILPPASAAIDPLGSGGARAASLDSRDTDSALPPTPGQLDATRALVAAAPDGARVTWDERFGTPRSAIGTGGYLTAARSGSAVDVARSWVSD